MRPPPSARPGTKRSPPIVQAKSAAKTGSSEKMRLTFTGAVNFCAHIWMKKAESVGTAARKAMVRAAGSPVTASGRPESRHQARAMRPVIQN
jgi:hypothetical protein